MMKSKKQEKCGEMKLSHLYRYSDAYKNPRTVDPTVSFDEHQHIADKCIEDGRCHVVGRVSSSLVRIATITEGEQSLARIIVPEIFVISDSELE